MGRATTFIRLTPMLPRWIGSEAWIQLLLNRVTLQVRMMAVHITYPIVGKEVQSCLPQHSFSENRVEGVGQVQLNQYVVFVGVSLDEVTHGVHRPIASERLTDTELLGGQSTGHGFVYETRHKFTGQTAINAADGDQSQSTILLPDGDEAVAKKRVPCQVREVFGYGTAAEVGQN